MKLLVTGATGFLGLHVLDSVRLRLPQAKISAVVRRAETWRTAPHSPRHGDVQVIEASLTETGKIARAWGADSADEPRAIVHLAASVHHSRRGGQALHADNVAGTKAMVALAHATSARLLFVSTSGTVGCHKDAGHPVTEDAPFCEATVGRWPYYASKIACEKLVQKARLELGLRATIVRPPVMLGPWDHRFRATSLIVRYLRGKLPFYLSGGMHFIDIRDAAAAMTQALTLDAPAPIYHLTGWMGPLRDYFTMLSKVSGVPAPKYRLPNGMATVLARATLGKLFDPVVIEMGQHHWDLSSSRAHELAFASRPPLTTLGETVAWLRQAHPKLH